MTRRLWLISTTLILTLTGCASTTSSNSDHGYYGGDSAPPATRNYDRIPDAVPKLEPLSKTGNRAYTVLGKKYIPMKSATNFTQSGMASWYGSKFHGRRTSSGEIYDMWAMTAAHPVLPLPTYVQVTKLETGKTIVVKVNDRGPFLHNRIIDLSFAAAHKIGIANTGTGRVKIVALNPGDYANLATSDETIPQSNAQQSMTDVGSNKSYLVQIGAYSDQSNALDIRMWLKSHNFSLHPESNQQQLAQGVPYRVQVGPFQSKDSALHAKSNLEQLLGQPTLLIIK